MHIKGCCIVIVLIIPHLEVSDIDSDTVNTDIDGDVLSDSEYVPDMAMELVAVSDVDTLSEVEMEELIVIVVDGVEVCEVVAVDEGVGWELVDVGSVMDNVMSEVILLVSRDMDPDTVSDADGESDVDIGSDWVWTWESVGVGPGDGVTGRDIVAVKVHVDEGVALMVCGDDRVAV